MPLALQVPNPAMPQDQLGMINMSNSKDTQNAMNKKGCQLLVNYITQNTQSVTSASFVPLDGFQNSITASGGVITIIGNFSIVYTILNNTATISISIDGNIVTSSSLYGTTQGNLIVLWIGVLPVGQHKIEIKMKISAGTDVINGTDNVSPQYSSLFIREDGSV